MSYNIKNIITIYDRYREDKHNIQISNHSKRINIKYW